MASRFWVGGTGTWDASDTTHWAATSGGAGGQSVPGSGDTVTFDGSSGGGTVTLGYNPSVTSITMGTFTGTLNFGSSSPTMQTFSASGTAIRGLTMGSGSWTITGNNGNIWDFNTITNLTFNRGTAVINCTYSGSVGTRSFFINLPTVRPYRVNITAGTDTIDFSSGNFEDLDFTGFSGTLDTDAFTVAGNLTLSPTMTIPTSANALTFTATTTGKTVTMNGVQFNRPITFNGVGGGWTLQDNLDMSGASNRALTLTNGSFNANNFNVTCGSFSSSNSNTRVLTMGSGTWTMLGTGTVWTTGTSTNLTVNKGTSTIAIADTSSSSKTVILGNPAFANLFIAPGGTGAVIFSVRFTVDSFSCTGPKSLQFNSTSSYTVSSNGWRINGYSGQPVTIAASTPGSAFTLSVASGTITSYFLSLRDSTATGGATFNAKNSTDVSGNTGWNFIFGRSPVYSRVAVSGRVATNAS